MYGEGNDDDDVERKKYIIKYLKVQNTNCLLSTFVWVHTLHTSNTEATLVLHVIHIINGENKKNSKQMRELRDETRQIHKNIYLFQKKEHSWRSVPNQQQSLFGAFAHSLAHCSPVRSLLLRSVSVTLIQVWTASSFRFDVYELL